MEKENNNVEEYVRRVVTPIFDKVLQETPKNRLSVGRGRFEEKKELGICFYNPHNYRLYFDFLKSGFTPTIRTLTDPLGSVYLYRSLNHGKEHFYDGFMGCKITVKKNSILLMPKEKREYIIDLNKPINPQIVEAVKEKDSLLVNALKGFIKAHGGSSKFNIVKRWVGENKIIGEEFIQKIDPNILFRNPVVKKVYHESNVEFADPVYVVNYLQNRALENVAPDINQALQTVLINQDPLKYLKSNVKGVEYIIDYANIIRLLSDFDRMEFWNWIIETYGCTA